MRHVVLATIAAAMIAVGGQPLLAADTGDHGLPLHNLVFRTTSDEGAAPNVNYQEVRWGYGWGGVVGRPYYSGYWGGYYPYHSYYWGGGYAYPYYSGYATYPYYSGYGTYPYYSGYGTYGSYYWPNGGVYLNW